MMTKTLIESLKKHEGCRLKAYQDTVGVWTIGYGHTKGVKEGDTCSQEQADAWLLYDAWQAFLVAEMSPEWGFLDTQTRKDVWVEMVFNLGWPKLEKFIGTRAAIRKQDWKNAAQGMLNSKWASQVKGRAFTLAAKMERG